MKPQYPSLEEFLELSAEEVANIVRTSGSKVVVFPINGTRRWFMLEYGDKIKENVVDAYLDISIKSHIETYKLFYKFGLHTIIAPIFGGELLNRGDDYVEMAVEGMARLATHPDFLSFYQECNIRVGFYGDYVKQLDGTPYVYLCDLFEETRKKTMDNEGVCLFYGMFASESTESIAQLTINYYQATGQLPTRRNLIELYYGEYIEKADIFIGFEKFNVFDYPLLSWGEESLYFTVAPSLYFNERQLRSILYDYIYLRPVQDPVYEEMPAKDFDAMRNHYKSNQETIFGVGEMRGGIWYANTRIK